MKRFAKFLLIGVAATVALVGCGRAMVGGGEAPEASFYTMHSWENPGHHGPLGLVRQLGLSSEQSERLKAIAESHRDKALPADWTAKRDELKTLVLADTVDPQALKSFLEQAAADHAPQRAKRVEVLAEMRAVLTEGQRETLAKTLSEPAQASRFDGMRRHMTERFLADLNLTGEQKAAFDALHAKLEEQRLGNPHRDAFVAFTRTGDGAALTEALAKRPHLPMDEVVALAVKLDSQQRQKLVEKLERFGAKAPHFGHRFGH